MTEVMVCDVSRDRVQEALLEGLGNVAQARTVHGHATPGLAAQRTTQVDSWGGVVRTLTR